MTVCFQQTVSPEQAFERLVKGNERYRNGTSRPDQFALLRSIEHAKGQYPFATILGCSDARVPPEIVFDADQGDLFVIRIAGNVLSPEVSGSLQYAGSHLHTSLFVVLGHDGCGAVSAALETRDQGAEQRSRIQFLVNAILPGLPKYDSNLSAEARLSNAVESNVRWTMQQALESVESDGCIRLADGNMKIVGAVYDIASGRVRFLVGNEIYTSSAAC